jgi:hypothetical protein
MRNGNHSHQVNRHEVFHLPLPSPLLLWSPPYSSSFPLRHPERMRRILPSISVPHFFPHTTGHVTFTIQTIN